MTQPLEASLRHVQTVTLRSCMRAPPILLVDDRRANLDALEAVLGTQGYELVTTTSGGEAIEQLEKREFAVILLDFQMPTMDGIETARNMTERAAQLGRRAPIIFVTAIDIDRARRLEAYGAGAVDVMQKPFEAEVLRAKVAVFADLYRSSQLANEATRELERERQGAKEEARRFQLLVESVKDYAIFILDPGGNVATWNQGAERIKGYTASEIIGKHFSTFYPPEVAATGKCDEELEIATREGRFEEEGWRLRKDGSRIWANVTITALREPTGTLVGFAKVTRDLTERVKNEATLQQLAAEKAAHAEKVRVQEFQERFIAILGHDLRNPLSAIDMGTGLLRQRAGVLNDERLLRLADRMKASARRMSRMIEQILDLTRSRLAGGLAITPESMSLCPTVAAIVDEIRAAHPGRTIDLRCPPTVAGTWDRDRLEQVFSNLVGNAVHYGDPQLPVTIDVRDEGTEVSVAVHNEGPPIPEAVREELFSPFRRGERDSKKKETEGLGLGLYISREVIVAHGGDIDVRSTSTHGTTFRVRLPRTLTASPSE
jgi:sigma-B regulation protein RsbU (phosphoserine phosphatase)